MPMFFTRGTFWLRPTADAESTADYGAVVAEERFRKVRHVGESQDRRDVVPVDIDTGIRKREWRLLKEQRCRPLLGGFNCKKFVASQQHRPDSRGEVGGLIA